MVEEFSKRELPLIQAGRTYTVKRSRYLTGDLGFELVEFSYLWKENYDSEGIPIVWDAERFSFSYDKLLELFQKETSRKRQ